MYLLYGSLHMESGNYPRAIQSFEHARVKFHHRIDRPPLIVALVRPLLPRSVLTSIPSLTDIGVEF